MCWPVADSVVVGWVARLGGGVGGGSVVGLASGWLVVKPLGGGLLGVVGSRGGYIVGSGFGV